jgi:imidazolonepropionase-like amidohydrolase
LGAARRFVGLLIERRAPVLAGSDIPCGSLVPGASLWRELSLLVEAGMSPEQALRTATADAGAFLGKPGLGRLAPGSPADLVAVAGDPTLRIPDPPEVTLVVRAGVAHQPADLLAEANEAAEGYEEDPWSVQFKAHWDAGSRKYAQEAEE